VFTERETALLIAAVYPTMGREQRFQVVNAENAADVHAHVSGKVEKAGWLRHAPRARRGPERRRVAPEVLASLALLLEAASYEGGDRHSVGEVPDQQPAVARAGDDAAVGERRHRGDPVGVGFKGGEWRLEVRPAAPASRFEVARRRRGWRRALCALLQPPELPAITQ